jgi:GTPase SAR1 family protein
VFVLQDQYNVLCIGPSASGKSTILWHLTEDSAFPNRLPTNGFNIKTLPIRNLVFSIQEVGGSQRLQPYWHQYFADKQALLYVVNAAAEESELIQARDTLEQILTDSRLHETPVLILGTHTDLVSARSDHQLEKMFAPVIANRKWSVVCCCSFDRTQVLSTFEMLIDMLLSFS